MPAALLDGALLDDDAGAFLDHADPAQEEAALRKLGFDDRSLLGRQRDEKATGGLRVVAEHDEAVGHPFQGQVPPGEVAVPRIAARANPLAREVESTVDRREPFRL